MTQPHNTGASNEGPLIDLAWGADPEAEKFMHVEEHSDGLKVIMHPGLSYQQVRQAAHHLGEHSSAVIRAWQFHTGFSAK
jgi:hypothetical protein